MKITINIGIINQEKESRFKKNEVPSYMKDINSKGLANKEENFRVNVKNGVELSKVA